MILLLRFHQLLLFLFLFRIIFLFRILLLHVGLFAVRKLSRFLSDRLMMHLLVCDNSLGLSRH